ncbi:MAG: hypothetical protein J5959_13515 [Butyrivibrio sp.]|nr:hypothetical protein [Butyrivibrio sp.]
MGLENNNKEGILNNNNIETAEKEKQNILLADDVLDGVSGGTAVDVKKIVKTAYKIIVH